MLAGMLNSNMGNQDFISQAQALADTLLAQKKTCEADMASLAELLRGLNKKLAAIDVLLEGSEQVIRESQREQSATQESAENTATEKEDLTELVRDLTRGADTYGIRPRDITKSLAEAGKKFSAQYASNAMYRLKNRGEVVEYQGRYYWKGFEPPQAKGVIGAAEIFGRSSAHQQQTP